MRKLKTLANILLVIGIIATLVSGSFWLYSRNNFGLRQRVVRMQRKQLKTATSTSVNRIASEVMDNQYAGNNWHRMGTIVVPKLSIVLPIYDQPYDQEALKTGAQIIHPQNGHGQAVDTAMGNGNLILVAHNYNDGHTMFSALQQHINQNEPYLINGRLGNDDWLNGQKVYTANDQGIFEYVIDSQTAVSQDDLSVVKGHHKNELNILTCLYPADHYRIATHAILNRHWTWSKAPSNVVGYFDTRMNSYNLKN